MNLLAILEDRRWQRLCLLGGAALAALILVFPKLGFLQWIVMIPMLAAILHPATDALPLKKQYGLGFLMIYCYYFVIYHWFVALYPLEFAGLEKGAAVVVVLAGWLGLSLLQALPGGLILVLYAILCRLRSVKEHPVCKPFLLAALWVVFEWSSTLGWTGVPWGRLYLGQSELLPMIQSASVFGGYGITFLLVAVNGLLAYLLLFRRKQLLCGILASALFFSNLTFGVLRMSLGKEGETVRAAVIQGNISSHEKWNSASDEKMMRIYGDYTRAAAREGASLVVWPESTITIPMNLSQRMKNFVQGLAVECNVTLIVGALYYDLDTREEYNSLYLVLPSGEISEERYDKRHLVPFGEYVPMREVFSVLIPPLAELSIIGSDLSAGEDSNLFTTQWGEIGSMICFDSIYEMLNVASVRDGADLMVISSNDSWFQDSKAIHQHQAQARFRAIEVGRYLLRAANTGISSVITPEGRLLAEIEPLVDGYAVCDVSLRTEKTLYSVIGNLPVGLCIAFCAGWPIAELIGAYLKRKEGKSRPERESESE